MGKTSLDASDCIARLKKAQTVLDELGRHFDGRTIDILLGVFEKSIVNWNFMEKETIKEQRVRRQKLSKKMQQLAKLLESDPDTANFTLLNVTDKPLIGGVNRYYVVELIPNSRLAVRPTVAEVIRDFSVALDELRPMTNSFQRRQPLKKFVALRVFKALTYAKDFRTRPLKLTAQITSALIKQHVNWNSLAHDNDFDTVKKRKNYIK